jgi:hypothetical protein
MKKQFILLFTLILLSRKLIGSLNNSYKQVMKSNSKKEMPSGS